MRQLPLSAQRTRVLAGLGARATPGIAGPVGYHVASYQSVPQADNPVSAPEKLHFPLVDSSYDNQEMISCIATLLSGQLTMGAKVRQFEDDFADTAARPTR